MPGPRRNFGNHFVEWSPEANAVTIKPQHTNGTTTDEFGLGNALIKLNLSNLPINGIVLPITGETDGQGILPTSPFSLKRWHSLPHNLHNIAKDITGFNGWTMTITYPQAQGGSVKQVTSVPIIQNGYGCEKIVGDAPRLNW